MRALEDEDGRPVIELQLVRYNTVDSYGSVFRPGSLAKGLIERKPQLAWSHRVADIIGRAIDAGREGEDGPVGRRCLDDFDAVPRATEAHAQVKSGTIDPRWRGFSPRHQ